MISLEFEFLIMFSKLCHTCNSEGDFQGFVAFVLSDIKTLTHSCQILAILARSAVLSMAGVKSILKSHVCTIKPFGV